MKPKNMILLVVAVGCGLVASYMTSQLLANREKAVPTVKVLVAKKRLPSYTLLKDPETLFVEKEFPEDVAPKKAVTSFADVKDKRTNKVLNEEGVLLTDDLADSKTDGMAAQMGPGERAIAIKVNAESLAGGFVLPGSRVDVLHTLRGDSSNSEAKIILQNMLVLAVDTRDAKDPEQRSILGQTVTLSAKPEEAQRLTLAQSLGELRLTLRPVGDREVLHIKASKAKDLDKPLLDGTSGDAKEEEAAAPRPTTPLVPVLPPVVAAAPEEKPAPQQPQPDVKKFETHTLVIQNGEYHQKAIFTREVGETVWQNGQIGKVPEEALQQQHGSTKIGTDVTPFDPKPEQSGSAPASKKQQ